MVFLTSVPAARQETPARLRYSFDVYYHLHRRFSFGITIKLSVYAGTVTVKLFPRPEILDCVGPFVVYWFPPKWEGPKS